MKQTLLILFFLSALYGCKNNSHLKNGDEIILDGPIEEIQKSEITDKNEVHIHPIEHASMVLNWDGTIIYVDPVGGRDAYMKYDKPDLVLITHIHGDHLDLPTLESVVTGNTRIISPNSVYDRLPESLQKQVEILNNGDISKKLEITIEAFPMYNLGEEALQRHPKGKGNGYVLEKNNKRLYISGDTEDTPEMRNLKNIDIALVCMNLPYTMPVEKAAEAVLEFKPKKVYPYHYRGEGGLSDVANFKSIIEANNPEIEVVQLDWYPNN